MPRSTEAAVVVCGGGRQQVTRTMCILLLFNMSVCWRNMLSRRFSPSTRTCMWHLQLPVAWTYSIFLHHMGFLFPPTKLTASIIQASVCCMYKLYYFHKGKSFLSTSSLEKQTDTSKSQRQGKKIIILLLEDLEFTFCLSRDTCHICRALLVHTKYKLCHISLSLLAQIKVI